MGFVLLSLMDIHLTISFIHISLMPKTFASFFSLSKMIYIRELLETLGPCNQSYVLI